jgi:hypothetical protein
MQRAVLSLPLLLGMALIGAFLAPALTAQQIPAGKAGARAAEGAAASPLKQIGLAVMMYAQDYDEVLPPMENAATVKRLLLPYVRRNEAVFVHPLTQKLFQPNPTLSRRPLCSVSVDPKTGTLRPPVLETRCIDMGELAQVVAFYEGSPAPDGTRAGLFLDGHVQVIPETEWPRLKRTSKIP